MFQGKKDALQLLGEKPSKSFDSRFKYVMGLLEDCDMNLMVMADSLTPQGNIKLDIHLLNVFI